MALKYCPRVVALKSGAVVYDGPGQALSRDLLHDVYRSDADGLAHMPPPDAITPHAATNSHVHPAPVPHSL
jgi:ABC-type cobalamin/Fe3+-siderophores transport system ATPase subunit